MTVQTSRSFRVFGLRSVMALVAAGLVSTIAPLRAEQPGRGATGPFEIAYLRFVIDHHFSAVRMTELAAGTDEMRSPEISPTEGTSPSPTPASSPTVPKANLDELKSLARRENRVQREEILTAQRFLRDWYGIAHQPALTAEGVAAISTLEQAQAGADFDVQFMRILSRHHYTIAIRSIDCLVGSDVSHFELKKYCNGIVHAQISDIDTMRHLLCARYGICDDQPMVPVPPTAGPPGSGGGCPSGQPATTRPESIPGLEWVPTQDCSGWVPRGHPSARVGS